MKYTVIALFLMLLLSAPLHAQDYKKHTVTKGQTVTDIAKLYKITPYDIYRLNPDARNGLKENATILIPAQVDKTAPAKEKPTKVANTIHEVQPKETLYSLSKKYNVTVEDIQKANGDALKEGLKVGQQVIIPVKGSGVTAQVKAAEKADAKKDVNAYIYHIVEAGETKYSIAKKHGITVQLIEDLNPAVKDTLPTGYNLKLVDKGVVKTVGPDDAKPGTATYTVQPKETIYSISKKTGITEGELIALNPELKDGLKDGMVLKLPAGKSVTETEEIIVSTVKVAPGKITDLTKSLKKSEERELVLLMPFNLSRIESDTVRRQLLRTDKFLNMTLDFYAGALMAVDSAKTLGLPLKVRILDSKESKNTSDVNGLASTMASADAVIGPFFQNNVENAAALLAPKNIPVISPLSKDSGKPYRNLYNSIPSPLTVRMAMLDYLKSKNGNVAALVDSKKASSKEFIRSNYPGVKFIERGVNDAAIKAQLVKDRPNYIILDTDSSNMMIAATKIIAGMLPEYNIQLVVLEHTEALENDELPTARLMSLKLLYPSVTRDNITPEALVYARVFKEKNGIVPSQFATRGFDVTFDTILRLFQEDGFAEATAAVSSEQVENKFSYSSEEGGNYNTGVYIMQYDEQLTIKQAE